MELGEWAGYNAEVYRTTVKCQAKTVNIYCIIKDYDSTPENSSK